MTTCPACLAERLHSPEERATHHPLAGHGNIEGHWTHPELCPDCQAARRHAYSDATTPGFFYTTCEKHRPKEEAAASGGAV